MLDRPPDNALDAGPHKRAPGTQRFCAASGAVRPVDEMIRFVVGPDSTAVPDLKRRLPGRGIWITATRQALRSAITRKALARARVVALLNAAEAAPDGTRKLAAALRRRADAAEIAVIDAFTSAQLDLALGRSNVIHAALLAGPESERFLARTARLDYFRTGPEPGSPGSGRRHARNSAEAGDAGTR